MIRSLRDWWWRRRLIKLKEKALFELEWDMRYLKRRYPAIESDLTRSARERLAELRKADKPDIVAIGHIEEEIIATESNQRSYRQSMRLRDDIEHYLRVIKDPNQ